MNQGAKCQWWNLHEMLRSRSCWEAYNLLKSMLCCDIIMSFFWWKWWNLNAEKQVMLRSTQSAEKHALLWHYHVIFLMEMVKPKCWEAGHAEKHTICWKACFDITMFFLMEMVKLKCWEARHAEKHIICWEAHNLLKSMFCCKMFIYVDGKIELI